MSDNPEIGRQILVNGIATNVHDLGAGPPVLLIHGSGPGVSAWANWRLTLPALTAAGLRCIAPDMMGFGYTDPPADGRYSMAGWVDHLHGLVQALELERFALIGNSFGGALALAYAIRYPDAVGKLVLMGAAGLEFPLTDGLDRVWGYEASLENMRGLLEVFAFDTRFVNDDLAELRHRATIRPGVMERFSAMFPAPRQEGIRMLASEPEAIAGISVPALVVHGRDDRVIPVANAYRFLELLPDAELHVFGQCGHWTQIEKAARFNALVADFLS
ncbi:alpha/beta fold hydrolase [Salipiger sp. P9]|uniref:alpha/beta fold hydrolase n=1 Tax=Salipiger pentaromativorans TaxID=2943193 RepID=UPI0021579629|nr:alpha/beta hydrolase [Salipiger pentaromativorans]MCR8547402.1 alpha/beta fold hydrolase [Salipiger pentaromativorans]